MPTMSPASTWSVSIFSRESACTRQSWLISSFLSVRGFSARLPLLSTPEYTRTKYKSACWSATILNTSPQNGSLGEHLRVS